MKYITIEAARESYKPELIHSTMTVGELIALLEEYDEDAPIIISNDRGYTYGRISYDSIQEFDGEDEE